VTGGGSQATPRKPKPEARKAVSWCGVLVEGVMTPVRQLRVWENFVSSPAGSGTDPQKEVGFDALLGSPVIACFCPQHTLLICLENFG